MVDLHAVPRQRGRAAHGALVRELDVIDATCPLVTKVHKEGRRYADKGYDIVLIGHIGHPEVEGTLGQIHGPVHVISEPEDVKDLNVADDERVAFVTQTTLSVNDTKDVIAALKERFPNIVGPDTRDICYATQNRQSAVRDLVDHVNLILVVGAKNSSNSNRLRDLGEESGVDTYLIETADDLDSKWFDNVESIGISSGASTPDELVKEVIKRISSFREIKIEKRPGIEENIVFKLPRELTNIEALN